MNFFNVHCVCKWIKFHKSALLTLFHFTRIRAAHGALSEICLLWLKSKIKFKIGGTKKFWGWKMSLYIRQGAHVDYYLSSRPQSKKWPLPKNAPTIKKYTIIPIGMRLKLYYLLMGLSFWQSFYTIGVNCGIIIKGPFFS